MRLIAFLCLLNNILLHKGKYHFVTIFREFFYGLVYVRNSRSASVISCIMDMNIEKLLSKDDLSNNQQKVETKYFTW